MVEFPRCSVCRVLIRPGVRIAFGEDGRVHHVECPKVVCSVCSRDILPDTPIRRDGEELVHGNCWFRHERQRIGVSAPSDSGRADTVRARLATGALPSADPTKVWSGTSTGSVCLGCTGAILAGQIEYEPHFANAVVFRLHRACFLIWDSERRAIRRNYSGGSAASL